MNPKIQNQNRIVTINRRRSVMIQKLRADLRYSRLLNIIIIAMLVFVTIFAIVHTNNLNNRYDALQEKYLDLLQQQSVTELVPNVEPTVQQEQIPVSIPVIEPVLEVQTPAPMPVLAVTQTVVETTYDIPDMYEDIPLDNKLKAYIIDAADDANIPEEILFSMAWRETSYNPSAISKTDDHGLFQINRFNFKSLAAMLGVSLEEFEEMIYDPYVNTDCMIYILTECRDNYNNQNWHHVLMRYNLGPSKTNEKFADGIYSTWYTQTILEYAEDEFGLTEINLH